MGVQLFSFDPAEYAEAFKREGWVHVKKGVTDEFYRIMSEQVRASLVTGLVKELAIGDKQQAVYEFPAGGNYVEQLHRGVGSVCGLDPERMVLSERHVKSYDATAEPRPIAHKDRFASEISVGISVDVVPGSTLVVYPYDETEVNPFNGSVWLRASLAPEDYPEPRQRHARRVEVHDRPGDVVIFRGHRFWHLRENGAHTTMLYLKLNAMNCDPLGEDPQTPEVRRRTLAALELADGGLERQVARIGRRVDYLHRHYNRDWTEVPGVVLWGERHFTIDEMEMAALRSMDGRLDLCRIGDRVDGGDRPGFLRRMRRLAARGVIDLDG